MINTYNRLASLSEYDSPDMNTENDNMMGDFMNGPPSMPSMQQQPQTNNAGMMANYPTPLLDQYRNYLQAGLPNQANYKPGFGRKLLAGLGSLGTSPEQGMMYQEHMLNGPYNEAMQQYLLKGKLLGEGANVEEKQIANKRGIAAAEERARIAEEANKIKAANQESLDQARQNRAQQAIDNLQAKADESAKKAEEWKQKFEADQHNRDILNSFHDASLKALNDRHAADSKIKEMQIEEQKHLHETMKAKWEAEAADREKKIKDLEDQFKVKYGDNKPTTTVTTTKDAQRNVTGTKEVSKTLPNTNQPKVNQQQVTTPNVVTPNNDRDKATKYLQDHGKPVTEANIKYLLDNKGKW